MPHATTPQVPIELPILTELAGPERFPWANSPAEYYRVDRQWYLKNTGTVSKLYTAADNQLASTDAGGTYDIGWKGQRVSAKLGLIDVGVRTTHPEFAGVNFTGMSFFGDPTDLHDESPDSHGTGNAGVMLAGGNRISGITNAKELVVAKVVFDPRGLSDGMIHQAIRYCADQGCKVVCLPWSTASDNIGLREALEYAGSKGAIVVIAVPNAAQDIDSTPDYPSSWMLPNVVSVAATTREGVHYFSALGKNTVHLAAPGRIICTTGNEVDYVYASGTSLAAPMVSAVLGILAHALPNATMDQLITRLLASCVPEASLANTVSGGRLSLANALQGLDPVVVHVLDPKP